jgi:hypothetical protein
MKTQIVFVTLLVVLLSTCSSPTPELIPPSTVLLPSSTLLLATETLIPLPSTSTSQPDTPTPIFLPAEATQPQVPTRTPMPFLSGTPTPVGDIPTPSVTPTPSVPTAYSMDGKPVPCSKGPGIEYLPNITNEFDSQAEIVGKDKTGKWWYMRIAKNDGSNVYCWVQDKMVATGGDLSKVVVVEPQAGSVTAVNIYLDTDYIRTVVCGQKGETVSFRFRGEIVADGPIKAAKYIWETNAGVKPKTEQIPVRAWNDPANLKLNLTVPAKEGTYSLTLRVTFPNEMLWVVQFGVKCQ